MLLSTSKMFKQCYNNYAIPAFNVWNLEMITILFRAAEKAESPFIIQTSPKVFNHAIQPMLVAMVKTAAAYYPNTVFALHLDHGDKELAFKCIEASHYNSVMIDASGESFEKNKLITRCVVDEAHISNVAVEAELILQELNIERSTDGIVKRYLNTVDIEEFVNYTSCDSLAVAIGAGHGAYKYAGSKGVQLDVLKTIQQKLPDFPLVLHGGSAVCSEEVQRINAAGGRIGVDAKGISESELHKAIEYGVCKINIATDTQLLWTRIHREFFKFSPAKYNPIVPVSAFMEAFEDFCFEKFDLLKSTGKANQLKNNL